MEWDSPPLALDDDCLDLIITNATIMDPYLGIVKAVFELKNGLIAGVGHGGIHLFRTVLIRKWW